MTTVSASDNQVKNRVLLIEDEYYIADLYNNLLTQNGYRVEVAQDGDQGLKMAQHRPDLILLDIMLPKINGIKILSLLKADEVTKNIPIVLLTNLGQASIIKEAFRLAETVVIIKTYSFSNINQVLIYFQL